MLKKRPAAAVTIAGTDREIPEYAAGPNTRFLGRQQILDSQLNLYGHELLFRSGTSDSFSGDGDRATQQVIDNCLMMMPSVNKGISFINCTRDTLVSELVTLLPPSTTVLEVLETIKPDAELLARCASLKEKGYRFALDDFTPDEFRRPFLHFADFVKVDFLASDKAMRAEIYAMLKDTKTKLIAEKIETEEEMNIARAEGCEFFQGYFFSKPHTITTRSIPENHLVYLRLFTALSRVPANIAEVEALVMSDASICYRLLRLVNSALYCLRHRVTSIRSALLLVGDDEFRKLVTVALANVLGTTKVRPAVLLALERAKYCELMAPMLRESGSKLYLLGLLSLIDAILEMPMGDILDSLPLDGEMKAALLGGKGQLARVLELVRCHAEGDWERCTLLREQLGIGDTAANTIYLESITWADSVSRL
jgi:EAL and modified HD-GYP domain-containing signal transduction protein